MDQNNAHPPITARYVGASALALFFAFCILFISFRTSGLGTHGSDLDVKDQKPLAKLLEKRIVPGHPVYVFLMVRDQVRLLFTKDPKIRSQIMIEYARDRLLSSIDLYSYGEHQLALSTLMKAEVYLGRAAEELIRSLEGGENVSQQELRLLLDAIDVHVQSLQGMKQSRTDSEKVQFDQLLNYTLSLRDSLLGFSRTSFLKK